MKTQAPAQEDLRMTPQRRQVYEVLQTSYDHPTATDVFMRAKESMPSISLATVYNCLDALVGHGFIRQVNIDRTSTRFCTNLNEHVHFHCEACGQVMDVFPKEDLTASQLWKLPEGSQVTRVDIAIHGRCPDCAEKKLPFRA